YEVRAYDPHVKKDFVFADIEEAVDHSDLILILSDHDEFKELDWSHLTKMSTKQIFDTKNIVKNRSNDFKYINFGNLHESTNKEKILV
ncbi:UDP binding domain-containing protein, partial [Bacillus licheniformis]